MLSSDEDEDDKSRMTLRMKVAGVPSKEEVWMTVHWLVAGGSTSVCSRPLPGARCQVPGVEGAGGGGPLGPGVYNTPHLTHSLQSPVSSLPALDNMAWCGAAAG